MAEAAWWVRLRQRVAEAALGVEEADEGLKTLRDVYFSRVSVYATEPMPGPGLVAAFRNKLVYAMGWVTRVEDDLKSAVVYAQAAEILALRGGSFNPSVPLLSIQHLPQAEHALRDAMGSMQIVRVMAAEACTLVGWYRGYLSTAIALVDTPGIQDSLDLAAREYDTAVFNALQRTKNALDSAIDAVQIPCSSLGVDWPLIACVCPM